MEIRVTLKFIVLEYIGSSFQFESYAFFLTFRLQIIPENEERRMPAGEKM